jgi:hypothetical protein
MNKILFLANMALLGIIAFMSCNKADLATDKTTSEHSVLATASRNPCQSTNCMACTDHSSSRFDGIDPYLAKQLFVDYVDKNQPRLQIAENIEDANRLWFSLESLKNFIWQIEKEMCNKPCARENELRLGVRVYYAKYPSDMHIDGLRGLPKDYAEHHTLFMVPTYEDQTGTQVDFDPWNWGNDCTPTPLHKVFSMGLFLKKNSCFFSIAEPQYAQPWMLRGQPFGAMNHGNLEPPPMGNNGSGFDVR